MSPLRKSSPSSNVLCLCFVQTMPLPGPTVICSQNVTVPCGVMYLHHVCVYLLDRYMCVCVCFVCMKTVMDLSYVQLCCVSVCGQTYVSCHPPSGDIHLSLPPPPSGDVHLSCSPSPSLLPPPGDGGEASFLEEALSHQSGVGQSRYHGS